MLVPWGSTVLTEDTVFMSPTGDGTDSSTSLEQRREKAVPSLLSCFKYKYSHGNQTRDLPVHSKALLTTDLSRSIKKKKAN